MNVVGSVQCGGEYTGSAISKFVIEIDQSETIKWQKSIFGKKLWNSCKTDTNYK